MISAAGHVDDAVRAVKDGAFHFVDEGRRPRGRCARSSARHSSGRSSIARCCGCATEVDESTAREFVAGPSPATRAILDLVGRVARLSATVLILGESGTGKELLARLLHRQSARPDGPFVAVNLAAIPRELVESTALRPREGRVHRRASASSSASSSWRRAARSSSTRSATCASTCRRSCCARSRKARSSASAASAPIRTDFRLVAATNVDLEKAVKEGRFREDLFYRLNVIPMKVPPLRERTRGRARARALLPAALQRAVPQETCRASPNRRSAMLQAYWWPGNIRELENLIERLVAIERQGVDHRRRPALRLPVRAARSAAARRQHASSRRPRAPSSATSSSARSRRTAGTSRGRRATWGCRCQRSSSRSIGWRFASSQKTIRGAGCSATDTVARATGYGLRATWRGTAHARRADHAP